MATKTDLQAFIKRERTNINSIYAASEAYSLQGNESMANELETAAKACEKLINRLEKLINDVPTY